MLSRLPIRSKVKKRLTLGSVGPESWTSDTPPGDAAKKLQFLHGELLGTACSACNWSEDALIPCTTCNRQYCFNSSSRVAEKRCVAYEAYRGYIRGDQPWICHDCSRRSRSMFQPGALDPAQDTRGSFSLTVSPLLVICISAAGVRSIGTENIIDAMAASHWMNASDHYLMVRLQTCGDPNRIREGGKEASRDIAHFLRGGNVYRTRVLIILNTHSDEDDGRLTVEAKDGGFVLAGPEQILRLLLGDEVWAMLQSLDTIKGMVLICCGYALAIEESRKAYESLIENDVVSFVLGFSTKALIERHVQDGIAEFVKSAFIEVTDLDQRRGFDEEVGEVAPGRSSFARCVAFSRSPSVHSHTGVILLERVGDRILGSEFRRGLPDERPYGLPPPVCGFCGHPNNLTFWLKSSGILFKCTCGARTKGQVRKPDGIHEVAPKLLGPSHFVFRFPYATQDIRVEWRNGDGQDRKTDWFGRSV